jgi:hypothetical protein
MAIVQAVLALLARQSGRVLNTLFGWATTLLFGKVPEDRQIHLSIIGFGSVIWLIVVLGIAFPGLATFLLAFVPLPESVDANWVRIATLVAAIVIPVVVGVVSLLMLDPADRPEGAERIVLVLKGYPYTLGLALTMVMMVLFAPILKLPKLVRRWSTAHVPVMVESENYLTIVDDIQQAAGAAGWETERRQASILIRLPTKVLTILAGGAIENLVADRLTTLASDDIEITLHPSDLIISGNEAAVARLRATLAEQLAFAPAYFTWTRDAQALEDRLQATWDAFQRRDNDSGLDDLLLEVRAADEDLRDTKISYEEWEAIFRKKIILEQRLLQASVEAARRNAGNMPTRAAMPESALDASVGLAPARSHHSSGSQDVSVSPSN